MPNFQSAPAPYLLPLKLSDYRTERGGSFSVRDAVDLKLATVYYDTSGDLVSRRVRNLMDRDDALEVA